MESDKDLTLDAPPRLLKGFRRRWVAPPEASSVGSEPSADTPEAQFPREFPGETLFGDPIFDDDLEPNFDDWDLIQTVDEFPAFAESSKRMFHEGPSGRDFGESSESSAPRVLDPQHLESSWKARAFEADLKRARVSLPKLPWELEGTAFRPVDRWHGTALAGFDKLFGTTSIGASDVLDSNVVATRAHNFVATPELPVVPITLKKARREPLDEDIRRKALFRFRDLILQDPLSTQLGTSLKGRLDSGTNHEDVNQSFRDCFMLKASSTLQKRASSLSRLANGLRDIGQLHPWRMSEAQLYSVLCNMRSAGCGATSAQHVIEALHFLDATAKFTILDLTEIIFSRCRGVARDMYLGKHPLRQKKPLTVDQVRRLECMMGQTGMVFRCIIGQLLFCVHSCCRWRDSQRLKSISIESGHGETLVHADALSSKTALTAEAKTRFLPYAAIGTGVSMEEWALLWLEARQSEGLECGDFVLPSYSEKFATWLGVPMSASEATLWLRDFLHGSAGFEPDMVGSHSCKSTLLTWAGRSIKVPFSTSERRLLGHHLDPNMKSVLCYSRESYTTLYAKVLGMFRLIRSGDFCPDQSALDRVIQLADTTDEQQPGQSGVDERADEFGASDSESSAASDDSGAELVRQGDFVEERCVSLFPSFPGVPETGLLVHSQSGLVHVVNEDDVLLCGRPTSANFKQYALIMDREHLESCRQCLRSFQNRKG